MSSHDTPLHRDARDIFQAGLRAAAPGDAVRRHVRLDGDTLYVGEEAFDLDRFRSIQVVGMGKASAAMAEALEGLLGDRIAGGTLNVKEGHGRPLARISVREAGHPVPDQAGMAGTREMIQLLSGLGTGDLVFCLISGGGSALAPAPASGLTLAHEQEVTRLLLESGAAIQEINVIRKHLSRVRGGRLAQTAHPATVISLVLSDVIGDSLDAIASGPTVPDPSTFPDCLAILDRHRVRDRVPPAVLQYLKDGAEGRVPETPKPGDPVFEATRAVVVGSNAMALEAAGKRARALGYRTVLLSSFVEGETREVARVHAALAREVRATGNPAPPPTCLVSGGETTVTIRGDGKGGRNQEFALAAALDIQGMEGVVILSGGTDGTDGPTDAAGALADGDTVERAASLGLDARDHLDNNDAYPFFQALGNLIMTGPTLTNVMDLRLVMVNPVA